MRQVEERILTMMRENTARLRAENDNLQAALDIARARDQANQKK